MICMFCNECKKRDSCKSLCASALKYVNQDWVWRKEKVLIDDMDQFSEYDTMPYTSSVEFKFPLGILTEKQKRVAVLYYQEKKTQQEIADMFGTTKQAISDMLYNIQNIVIKVIHKINID